MSATESTPNPDSPAQNDSRRAKQRRDQAHVQRPGKGLSKGSGLEDLEDEQRQASAPNRRNKLRSDEVKHH